MPSSQLGAAPETQPEEGSQFSVPLQNWPSLQLSGVPGTQPEDGLQVSTPLQVLPSLQMSDGPSTRLRTIRTTGAAIGSASHGSSSHGVRCSPPNTHASGAVANAR